MILKGVDLGLPEDKGRLFDTEVQHFLQCHKKLREADDALPSEAKRAPVYRDLIRAEWSARIPPELFSEWEKLVDALPGRLGPQRHAQYLVKTLAIIWRNFGLDTTHVARSATGGLEPTPVFQKFASACASEVGNMSTTLAGVIRDHVRTPEMERAARETDEIWNLLVENGKHLIDD